MHTCSNLTDMFWSSSGNKNFSELHRNNPLLDIFQSCFSEFRGMILLGKVHIAGEKVQ